MLRLSTVIASPTLAINDFPVTQVATAKSLGVTIDGKSRLGQPYGGDNKESILWHRGHKRSKAPCPPSNLTTNLPSSYTPSLQLLQYCWGNCAITLRNKLQKLQNRAARVLTFADYDEDAGHLFEVLGWKNLVRQHEIVKATMVL